MSAGHPDWIITSGELQPLLGKVTLIDVREPEEVAESKIDSPNGLKLIPLGEVMTRVEREVAKDEDVVIYCAHGVRSMHALMAMAKMGYQRLRSLDGGICAWEEHLGQRPRH